MYIHGKVGNKGCFRKLHIKESFLGYIGTIYSSTSDDITGKPGSNTAVNFHPVDFYAFGMLESRRATWL